MDTEYILDCAFEMGELTPVEMAVLCSQRGAYSAIREAVDNNLHMPSYFLPNTARAFLDQAPLGERYFFALNGIRGLEFALQSFQGRVAHLVQLKAQHDLRERPNLLLDLYPELARFGTDAVVTQEADLTEGLVRMMAERMADDQVQRWNDDLVLLRDAVIWYERDGGQEFRQMLEQPAVSRVGSSVSPMTLRNAAQELQRRKKLLEKGQRTATARAKSAIKKATKLFQNLGKEKNLQMFISGEEVSLAHPDSKFKFVIKPLGVQGWLIDRTMTGRAHTPYELSLYTKDDVYLSKLCVYFSNTPVLDQVLAVSLFIEAGDELKILESANWYATEMVPASASAEKASTASRKLSFDVVTNEYPSLAGKVRMFEDAAENPRLNLENLMHTAFFENERHWEPFKGRVEQWVNTWTEPARQAIAELATGVKALQQVLQAHDAKQRELQQAEMCRIARTA